MQPKRPSCGTAVAEGDDDCGSGACHGGDGENDVEAAVDRRGERR